MKKYLYPILLALVSAAFYFIEKKLDANYYNDYTEETKVHSSGKQFDYLPTSTTGQVVEHAYYSLSYNEKHEQAEWVAYELLKKHTTYNDFKRPYFQVDPLVKTNSASWRNYKNSGYDRGHLCPAADRRFDKKAHDETFLTSNISPQKHSFNSGVWNDLEKKVRYWLKKDKQFYVVTGPVFGKSKKAIGSEQVTVPTHFYKVLLKYGKGTPKMIAFLIPHDTNSRKLKQFVVTTDTLEALLGFDFFSKLPDTIEDKLESDKNVSLWLL